ncbi:MAG: homoserine dehydrogenase [Dehalococcoidia bacterium]|nr:homoserine dehydrogenase [Dehalococcoidia bacterium]
MSAKKSVGVGLMGLGTIGGGVFKALAERDKTIAEATGCPVVLRRVLEKRPVDIKPSLLTKDVHDIIADPEIDVVIELLGGEHPAVDFIKQALLAGKHVVTANKEVIAKHGAELLAIARDKGVALQFEASVGGGIPLLLPLQHGLLANEISTIYGIINGTTNYILTRMSQERTGFAEALKKAQELGYAEADPSNDVEGRDAAYKLAILASVGFHTVVRPDQVYCEGISRLAEPDFRYAKELGYEIKLLAIAKQTDGGVEARVHPVFIPEDFLLAKVSGVYNAVQVEGDLVGKLIFYGRGAGAQPTSSAVISDLIAIGQSIAAGKKVPSVMRQTRPKPVRPISELQTKYYLRMSIADRPGVLAQIAKILGDRSISIASVIQKEADVSRQTAMIVIMTHPAREEFMQKALEEMRGVPAVAEVCNLIRVEE